MMLLIASAVALLLLIGFRQEFVRLRTMPRLFSPNYSRGEPKPFLSVLIPVRNEAHNITRCLDGIFAQNYAPFEVIVFDDGSTDDTPAILTRYARQSSNLRLLHSAAPPPGWTGKAHACQQAALAAQGEWLLFLDADTAPQPGLFAALVAHTHHYRLDMLTIFPFLELRSFWERLILPPFLGIIHATFPFERMNAPDAQPDEIVANGQCIFVRQQIYRAIGGHSSVYGDVLEDVQLARKLRTAGARVKVVEGLRYLRVRMYTNGREVVNGLTKNAIAGYSSGGVRSLRAGIRQFLLVLAPLWLNLGGLALLSSTGDVQAWVVCCYGAVVALVALNYWRSLLWHLYALPWYYALLWPAGLIGYGCIALRGLWKIRSGHGVTWKGRRYVGT